MKDCENVCTIKTHNLIIEAYTLYSCLNIFFKSIICMGVTSDTNYCMIICINEVI